MSGKLLLAIDQGTSSTKCILVDATGHVVARSVAPLAESCPQPGWVEQDAEQIWQSVTAAVAGVFGEHDPAAVAAVGIANQRESLLAWDRVTGSPLSPVLNWRDNRSAATVEAMRNAATEHLVQQRSGLPLDSMFSAAKAGWILDRIDPDRRRALAGEIVLGTIDSFILSRFGGEAVIEMGNASRTQLFNVHDQCWDADLCALFNVPMSALPRVVRSAGPFPSVSKLAPLPDGVPVTGVLGDSHAALFAHGAFAPGPVKATYGTGSSVMGLVQGKPVLGQGLCLSIGWMLDTAAYAVEGNIRSSGATLKWTADLLGMTSDDLVALGAQSDAQGVVIVPAFTGLGSPWWDRDAAGLISNLSLGSGRSQLARAALESIPHQIADVIEVLETATGGVTELLADGGPTRSDALMQLQADISGRPVRRAQTAELSALGAAHLAGLGAGFWSLAELAAMARERDLFSAAETSGWRHEQRQTWRQALERARLKPRS